MAVAPPLGEDAVGGGGAGDQVSGPLLAYEAGGDQPLAVAGGAVHFVASVRTLWDKVAEEGALYTWSTITLELVCLVIAVTASFIRKVPTVILAIAGDRGEDAPVVGTVSELFRTGAHRTQLLRLV